MILISKKDELGSNFVQWELFFEEPKPIFIRSLIVNGKRNRDFKNSKVQKE